MWRSLVRFMVLLAGVMGAEPLREPLPLDVVTSLRSHNTRSPIDLSPDGEWLAHTFGRPETVPRKAGGFAATGAPLAEGNARMQAALTHTRTGEVIRLGGDKGSSWGAVWSPDGQRVAFYADDTGEVGLWIWDKTTKKSERFPGVVARPFFGFEVPRWSADGRRLLCKILPAGMTTAEAIALMPDPEAPKRFMPTTPDQPSVFVLRANMDDEKGPEKPSTPPSAGINRELADLAILDVGQRRIVTRIERVFPTWYAWSPDESRIALSNLRGWAPNTQQSLYDLVIFDPATGQRRVVLENVHSAYGIDVSWSPDGHRLAHVASGQLGKGALHIVDVTDPAKRVTATGVPSFDTSDGERFPLWSAAGDRIYAAGADGLVWSIDPASGRGAAIGDLPGHAMRMLISQTHRSTVWSTDRERTIWALGRAREPQEDSSVYQIDVAARTVRRVFAEPKVYLTSFNVDASDAGAIVYASRDQRQPNDLWHLDTAKASMHRVTRLNDHLDRYELGLTRVIDWKAADGRPLKGALLLPPGYETGQKRPLVVWVYAGSNGSGNANTFGLTGHGSTFNMQVLATRGFAVLFPDVPVKPGSLTADIMNALIPGVDAAIAQGYADPDRLAVMGQSHGALNVLAIITSTPRFKAAVITAAVTHPDLVASYTELGADGTAASTGYFERGQGNMGGTPWQYPERYRENSPLFAFDRIQTPLLIGQGQADGRLIGADAIFVSLQRLGKKVEYRIYENEGHVISRKANVIDFWERRLAFLDEYMDLARDAAGRVILQNGRAKSRMQRP